MLHNLYNEETCEHLLQSLFKLVIGVLCFRYLFMLYYLPKEAQKKVKFPFSSGTPSVDPIPLTPVIDYKKGEGYNW